MGSGAAPGGTDRLESDDKSLPITVQPDVIERCNTQVGAQRYAEQTKGSYLKTEMD